MSDTEDALQPVTLRPIGVIRSPHSHAETTPIQPVYARGASGRAEILPEYTDGLRDLEGPDLLVPQGTRPTADREAVS